MIKFSIITVCNLPSESKGIKLISFSYLLEKKLFSLMPEKFQENKTIKLCLPFPSKHLLLVNTISNDQGSMDCILYLHDIIDQALRTCLVKCHAGFPISPRTHLLDGTLGNITILTLSSFILQKV